MRKKIDVDQLVPGMYVEELDRPWLETPFPLQGLLIRSTEEIDQLRRYCRHVYINTGRGVELASGTTRPPRKPVSSAPPPAPSAPVDDTPLAVPPNFATALREAVAIREDTRQLIRRMHEDIRLGRSIDTVGAKQLVGNMVDSITRSPDALIWMTHLKQRDAYTAIHSMNVCVLSLAFGHHLGLSREQLKELGLGALLHDIGKIRVPLEILNKPGRLSDQEMAVMQEHPSLGVKILDHSQQLSRDALAVVQSHHERVNGSGYPHRLPGGELPFYPKLVSIVDVYDAITSDRVYRAGMAPPEAMKLMYGWRGRDFEADLLERFVQCVGIYPSGSVVELATGEVGIVIPTDRRQRFKPIVMLVLDAHKRRYFPMRVLDYKLFVDRDSQTEIRRVLPPGSYGIDPAEIVTGAQSPPAGKVVGGSGG